MTIEQVRVHGPGDVRLDRVEPPDPASGDIVVRVAACGVCGSDLKYISMGGLMGPGPEPMRLGHEFAGHVDFVGSDVTDIAVGDRVVVNPQTSIGNGGPEGAFTTLLRVRSAEVGTNVFMIPDHMAFDEAALTEPVGVGMHAAAQADVEAGDLVVVLGVGPIGLAAVAAAVDSGARDVVAVDISSQRLSMASEIGAHATTGPDDCWETIRQRHGTSNSVFGPMAATDAFVECTGAAEVLQGIIANAGVGSRVSVAGLHFEDVPTNFLSILSKELTIRGSMEYPERFEDALELVDRRDLTPMISHHVALSDWGHVHELISGPTTFGKIMVTMD